MHISLTRSKKDTLFTLCYTLGLPLLKLFHNNYF